MDFNEQVSKKSLLKLQLQDFPGSGWAWLVVNKDGSLDINSTANQDNPLMGKEVSGADGHPSWPGCLGTCLLYLKYQNKLTRLHCSILQCDRLG